MKHRPLGVPDFFQNGLNHRAVHRRRKQLVILGGVVSFQLLGFDIASLKIDGNIHPYRAGTAGRGQMPRLFQRKANPLRVFDHHGVFGHGRGGLNDVVLLVAHGPERRFRKGQRIAGGGVVAHLSAYNEHGNGVQPAAHHAGQGVGSAGACGDADCGNPVVQTGIGLRRHGAGLLVMIVGYMQLGMMSQRVIEMHSAPADHAENVRHAPGRQKIGHIVRQSLLHKVLSPTCPAGNWITVSRLPE